MKVPLFTYSTKYQVCNKCSLPKDDIFQTPPPFPDEETEVQRACDLSNVAQ